MPNTAVEMDNFYKEDDGKSSQLQNRQVDACGHHNEHVPRVILQEDIASETELIDYIRSGKPTLIGGRHYMHTTKAKLGKVNNVLVYSFWLYNKFLALFRRKEALLSRPSAYGESVREEIAELRGKFS